jgi:hypothetical protein
MIRHRLGARQPINSMISPLLDSLLDPRHVALDLRGHGAGEAVWEIVQLLGGSGALRNPKEFFEAVMAREAKSSTSRTGALLFRTPGRSWLISSCLGSGAARAGSPFALKAIWFI